MHRHVQPDVSRITPPLCQVNKEPSLFNTLMAEVLVKASSDLAPVKEAAKVEKHFRG